mmetsp:Transcript_29880/g.45277  ORF Transcript_29880/g.45277 Transcript_29880/m.45277 type:complete len:280 (-) Transcript_29880:677-1516(-)
MGFILPVQQIARDKSTLPSSFISINDILLAPEFIYGPLNPETPEWTRSLVWTDFRLAVVFFVVFPFIFLGWSAWTCRPVDNDIFTTHNKNVADAVLRLITGYWQASALLLITVLWNIESSPIGVVTGALAQMMIVISLTWWESLNEEAAGASDENVNLLGSAYTAWRTITSWIAAIGVIVQVPFLSCATGSISKHLQEDAFCAAWLEPPQTAASLLSINSSQTIHNFATVSLVIYLTYLIYYVSVPLPNIGRDGRAPRPFFTFIDGWVALGFLEKAEEK